jgi:hypothetical protein
MPKTARLQEAEMATGHSQTTTDHQTIRRWVEERRGCPASVKGTERGDDNAGILRINFPGTSADESLEDLDWDTFFDKFEESKLAFVYQDETADGKESRFAKFVRR